MQSWAEIAKSEQVLVQTCVGLIQPAAQPLNWANSPAVVILTCAILVWALAWQGARVAAYRISGPSG
jgi:hypothetical protein